MEQTISIKNLIFQVLFRWRRITVFAFALAFLLGGNQGLKQYQALSDPELAQALRQKYEDELFEYETTKTTLETYLTQRSSQFVSTSLYKDESILMTFDPYNVYMGSVEVYIDSYFQILSDSSVQNTDKMGKIMAAYQSKLNYGEMYTNIGVALDSDLSMKYMKELVSTSYNAGSGTMNFTVRMDTYDGVETVLDVIMDHIETYHEIIKTEVADHDCFMTKSAINAWIDDSLLDRQENLDVSLANTQMSIITTEKELFDLEKEDPGEYNPTFQVIKLFLIGGFVGGILAVGYIVVKVLFSSKLEEESFVEREFDAVVLGVKPMVRAKGNGLDRSFEKMYNQSLISTEEEFYAYLETAIVNQNKNQLAVHVTGSIDSETISSVFQRISGKLPKTSTSGGFLFQDKQSLASLEKAQGVILVEQRNKTDINVLDREMKYLEKMGKTVVGVVVL